LLVLVLGIAYLWYIKPAKISCAYQPYFAQMNAALKQYRPGASAGIIDLDSLDNNEQVVLKQLGNDFKLRIVTKSLPSLDLLRYLMEKGNTNRLMVFSEPYIAEILKAFNPDSLDLLLGKPLPADAMERLSADSGWSNINWLIDTKERLNKYLEFAKKRNAKIRISLEIDVGLHRGGFIDIPSFAQALDIIMANPQYLQLTGLMGYDGHVPYVPFYINKQKAVDRAFVSVQKLYTAFVDELRKRYDTTFINSLTFNGGGSKTYFYYPRFKNITPINDIAMGSGFLSPFNFSELENIGHHAALFLSSPVIKKINVSELPHAEKLSPLVNWWNPNLKVSYYMLGGGWPGVPVAPKGIQRNPFWDENAEGYSNLLPNQSILSSSDENDVQVGDFVISQAWEGDGMLVFKKVLLYRQGKITGEWNTYDGGN
ncbi:MAG TPA: alanine racemase, partial [Chitinophagales bacterium]|nr:alanine racemase [Chitinophagales bacterium]